MKKEIETLTMGKLIFKAAIYSFYGWFIFAVIEIIIRLMERPYPWSFMILFTLFLYCGIGIAVGAVLGGAIFLLLKVAERWRQMGSGEHSDRSRCTGLPSFSPDSGSGARFSRLPKIWPIGGDSSSHCSNCKGRRLAGPVGSQPFQRSA